MTQPAEPEAVRAVSERLKANSGGSGQAEPLPPSCFPLVITRTLVAITKVETLNPGTFAGESCPRFWGPKIFAGESWPTHG